MYYDSITTCDSVKLLTFNHQNNIHTVEKTLIFDLCILSVLTERHDISRVALGGAADAFTPEIQTQYNLGGPGPSQYNFSPQPW